MKTFEDLKKLANENKGGLDKSDIKNIEKVEELFDKYALDIDDLFQDMNTFNEEDYREWLSTNLFVSMTIDDYNEFVDENGYDEYIYRMSNFDKVMRNYTPTDIAELVTVSDDFNIYDDYFYFNRNEELGSCTDKTGSIENVIVNVLGHYDYVLWYIETYYPEMLDPSVLYVIESLFE